MTKNIIVMGISGAGKSSVLNDLFGINSATARSANSCTQVTKSFKASLGGEPVTVWDCPGTFDEERTLEEWAREVVSATHGEGFHQIMLVINATMRVGTIDILFITVVRCLLKKFRCDQGITTYFTHCDAAREYYDEETRKKYIAALNKKCKLADLGLPLIDDRKTIAFLPQKIMTEKPEEAKYALRKTAPESKRGHFSHPGEWEHFRGSNCYNNHGGKNVDLQRDNANPMKRSIEDAKRECEQNGYAGFTYEPRAGRMWPLRSIEDPRKFTIHPRYDVYALKRIKVSHPGDVGLNIESYGTLTEPCFVARDPFRDQGLTVMTYFQKFCEEHGIPQGLMF